MSDPQYVLPLSCPDRPGIVGAVSGHLAAHGGNILEAQQFGDAETTQFLMRLVGARCRIVARGVPAGGGAIRHAMAVARSRAAPAGADPGSKTVVFSS
jgi:glycine cleavage system regulatory protein